MSTMTSPWGECDHLTSDTARSWAL